MFNNNTNKDIARRLIEEGFNKHDLRIVDEILTVDAQTHDTDAPTIVGKGPSGLKTSMQPYLEAFSDVKLQIERELTDGDFVVQYVRSRGTHTAPLGGIPATNKKIDVTGIITSKFKDSKVVETWVLFDQLGLMKQLGVVEVPTIARTPELVGAR
jgi:predicted ester cyclase